MKDSFSMKMLPETLLYPASLNINKGERRKTYSSMCVFTETNPTQPSRTPLFEKKQSVATLL